MRQTSIQVLDRAVDILAYLEGAGAEVSVSEVANALGLDKGTTHRIITCLAAKQLVARNAKTHRYRLGVRLFELGTATARQWDLRPIASPLLERLRDACGHTVGLFISSDNYRVCIDQYESRNEVRRALPLGKVQPIYPGASGKIFLAYMPRPAAQAILVELLATQSLRGKSRDLATALAELDAAVSQGYASSVDEQIPNAASVAVPIFDHTGRVAAAITIATTTFEWTAAQGAYLAEQAKAIASEISAALGHNSAIGCQAPYFLTHQEGEHG